MLTETSQNKIFYSKRDWWAAILFWGIVLFLWGTGLGLLLREGPSGERLSLVLISFMSGAFVLWFWFTTRYRVTEASLHLQSGPFNKKLKWEKIQRVVYTRKGWGISFALSQDILQIDVEGSSLGYRVSPQDRRGFLSEVVKQCDHLMVWGEDLIPRTEAGEKKAEDSSQ